MPKRAVAFVVVTAILGSMVLGNSLLHWHSDDLLKFGSYFAIAMLAATMKVRLPGIESTMSVHFLFILLGVLELSPAETIVIACSAAVLQSVWKTRQKPEALKVVFNVLSMTANAVFVTQKVYSAARSIHDHMPLLLLLVACSYFVMNTVPLSIAIALSQRSSVRKTWSITYFWSFPYYLVGAALAGLISFCNRYVGWESSLLIVPVMFWIFRTYYLYLARLEGEKKRAEMEAQHAETERRHVEQVCALHLRTIEGLALAIEAKDHSTHTHLHRVGTYATELAKELGLSDDELDALRAAALLHDIGKLGVPDHIINKPGRLTPEEFEKIKIHPIVGAEIIEKVAFPYPVAPIVRSHHEKWNGEGYPDGLKGENIPIGARILSVVDCLDALASSRQYRKALPLSEAIQQIEAGAGESFDPEVVAVLKRRYVEFERLTEQSWKENPKDSLSLGRIVQRGHSPGAGFELNASPNRNQNDFLSSIAAARQEAHTLFELSQDLGNSLSLNETLSLVAMRLRKLVPYDSIAAFVRKDELLIPEFTSGEHFKLLSSLRIPLGTGLCGWVAANTRPIINGNPMVEVGIAEIAEDGNLSLDLRSALAVPLEGVTGLVGVLALYQAVPDAFTADHLRILQVITSRVAMFIENALKYREAESSATIDYLTGMANARALSVHLEKELARCRREKSALGVIVCDLDGFKEINDRYGHLAGDRVLKLFASSLSVASREYDYAARMGGDEFVVVAPGITESAAIERADLLSALAKQAGRDVCGAQSLSLSAGTAFYPQDGVNAEQLLAEADRRMYATKRDHHESFGSGLEGEIPEQQLHLQFDGSIARRGDLPKRPAVDSDEWRGEAASLIAVPDLREEEDAIQISSAE
jgi:diguanylate cyclase (GGDEF)-like protein/putative nucleotidyltransferase with HDIG domain